MLNHKAFLVALTAENPLAVQEIQRRFLGWEDLLERGMAPHSSILAWVSHGQKSLAGYCPWGHKESDMTE